MKYEKFNPKEFPKFHDAAMRGRFVERFNADQAFSYLDRSVLSASGLQLFPWSYVANDWFRKNARAWLRSEGLELGHVTALHLKPKDGQ